MRPILLIITCFVFNQLFAQDSTFHLKDYKYRTPGYHALEINIGLNGGLANSKSITNVESEMRSINLAPSVINFYRIKSLEKRIHTSSIQLSPSYSLNKNSDNFNKATNRSISTGLAYNRNDKFYKNRNNYFELGNSFSGSILSHRQENDIRTQDIRNYFLSDNVVLGIGKGRIEAVQDAQMALFILNDLQEQGLITHVDAALINEFAQLITGINNRRIFDGRNRRIYELTQIESFLKNKNITPQTDIRHFTTINDNWSLAYNPLRFSGTNIYLRFIPSVGIDNSETNINDNIPQHVTTVNENKFFSVAPHIGVERYVPVNLKWQRNMGIDLSWQKTWNEFNSSQTSSNNNYNINRKTQFTQYALNTNYGIGYYPNNRTLLNASINANAFYSKFDEGDIKDRFSIVSFLQFDTNYFISYRSRLFANFKVGYNQEEITHENLGNVKQNQFFTNFSIAFSHIIF